MRLIFVMGLFLIGCGEKAAIEAASTSNCSDGTPTLAIDGGCKLDRQASENPMMGEKISLERKISSH